jgi:hypothetical protein
VEARNEVVSLGPCWTARRGRDGKSATHDDLVVVPGLVLATLAPLAEARGAHVDLGAVLGRTFDPDRVGLQEAARAAQRSGCCELGPKRGARELRDRGRPAGDHKPRGTDDVLMAPVAIDWDRRRQSRSERQVGFEA